MLSSNVVGALALGASVGLLSLTVHTFIAGLALCIRLPQGGFIGGRSEGKRMNPLSYFVGISLTETPSGASGCTTVTIVLLLFQDQWEN